MKFRALVLAALATVAAACGTSSPDLETGDPATGTGEAANGEQPEFGSDDSPTASNGDGDDIFPAEPDGQSADDDDAPAGRWPEVEAMLFDRDVHGFAEDFNDAQRSLGGAVELPVPIEPDSARQGSDPTGAGWENVVRHRRDVEGLRFSVGWFPPLADRVTSVGLLAESLGPAGETERDAILDRVEVTMVASIVGLTEHSLEDVIADEEVVALVERIDSLRSDPVTFMGGERIRLADDTNRRLVVAQRGGPNSLEVEIGMDLPAAEGPG